MNAEYLNKTVWCTIGQSKIHGIGVLALRDIKKGTRIYCTGESREYITEDLDKILPEIRKLIIQRYPIALDGHQFQSPNADANLISFMNHSDTPNYDNNNDTALRDIKAGEEITEDYGKYKGIIDLV